MCLFMLNYCIKFANLNKTLKNFVLVVVQFISLTNESWNKDD